MLYQGGKARVHETVVTKRDIFLDFSENNLRDCLRRARF